MDSKTKLKIAGGLIVAYLVFFGQKGGAVIPLNQGDPRWKNKKVGNGVKSYGAIGCVVTSVTMTVNALRGTRFAPDDLMPGGSAGLSTGDYNGGGIKSAEAFAKLGCKQTGRIDGGRAMGIPAMCSVIDSTLGAGQIAVLRVDYDTSEEGSNHSVVCFKKEADHYVCADPAGGVLIRIPASNLVLQRTSTRTYTVTGIQSVARA